MPNPQARGPPLVSYPQLLIQYTIHSYPSYLEAIPFTCNPRTLHAVVTGAHKI
jgi:hypothetical protein